MVAVNVVDRLFQAFEEFGFDHRVRRRKLRFRNAEIFLRERCAVEFFLVLEHRPIAARAHGGENFLDRRKLLFALVEGAR